MDVIGAGFGRTGTLATKLALDWLGLGPCHHLHELLRSPERIADWQAVAAGAPLDWSALLDGYHSTMDWPSAVFWRELVDDSRARRSSSRCAIRTAGTTASRRPCTGRFDDRTHATERFRAHVGEVIDYVPANRLLLFDVADGWAPLCDFLGVTPPDAPFPDA